MLPIALQRVYVADCLCCGDDQGVSLACLLPADDLRIFLLAHPSFRDREVRAAKMERFRGRPEQQGGGRIAKTAEDQEQSDRTYGEAAQENLQPFMLPSAACPVERDQSMRGYCASTTSFAGTLFQAESWAQTAFARVSQASVRSNLPPNRSTLR